MGKLRVMGVEEAFNIPVKKCPDVEFVPAPGGTGAMIAAMEASPPSADVCIALTECIVAAVEKGSPVRILAPFVTSPLVWGICVLPGRTIEDLSNATWGVSRMGSGSHVMASVLAKKKGWLCPSFEVCGSFSGLREALRVGTVDAFLWEKFTTSPFETSGDLKIVGEIPTPWGAFSAAINPTQDNVKEVSERLDTVLQACRKFEAASSESTAPEISASTGMREEDAVEWHSCVRYAAPRQPVPLEELTHALATLQDAGVVAGSNFSDSSQYTADIV